MTPIADHSAAPRIRPGHGTLKIQSVAGQAAATAVQSSSPLKLLVPRPRGRSVWAYTSSFGGGLVAGDETRLNLTLDPGTRCYLGTQASTKVYRNPRQHPCGHVTRATVGAGSLLVFAPDPVQAFAGSSYTQRQDFQLDDTATLVLLDWFTSGRSARGERWQFKHFQSRNAVYRITPSGHETGSELVFLDSLLLNEEAGPIGARHRTGRFNCFATLLVLGPEVQALARAILDEVRQRPVTRQASLLSSASPIRDGAVLRLAGEDVEAVGRELHRHLSPLREHLGDDPWARKW